ncbi:hypothetical protein B0H65DRAFT_551489 [Neurospora tetraspora]|uniref:Uncharacterized protein n=1 Tax=Neurospora tetraspora TaxID=94610 RepID=A0AAE0J8R0_9PEZI|nr:hypothetical protein B0H65DRAFT_551489 [Neurospora tetraspora]
MSSFTLALVISYDSPGAWVCLAMRSTISPAALMGKPKGKANTAVLSGNMIDNQADPTPYTTVDSPDLSLLQRLAHPTLPPHAGYHNLDKVHDVVGEIPNQPAQLMHALHALHTGLDGAEEEIKRLNARIERFTAATAEAAEAMTAMVEDESDSDEELLAFLNF